MFSKVLIFLLTILAPVACTVGQKNAAVKPMDAKVQAKEVGPYYYYTQSHLMKKRGDLPDSISNTTIITKP
jgi:hypothetical protein